jgi:hypothetical protein
MERWDSSVSRWQRAHLVLTQAGFLHCFAPDSAAARAWAGGGSGSGGGSRGQLSWGGAHSWSPPLESLNLSRCSFEQGKRRGSSACRSLLPLFHQPQGRGCPHALE